MTKEGFAAPEKLEEVKAVATGDVVGKLPSVIEGQQQQKKQPPAQQESDVTANQLKVATGPVSIPKASPRDGGETKIKVNIKNFAI